MKAYLQFESIVLGQIRDFYYTHGKPLEVCHSTPSFNHLLLRAIHEVCHNIPANIETDEIEFCGIHIRPLLNKSGIAIITTHERA